MLLYAIIAFVFGILGWAFHRSILQSRPVSTVAMYAGLGIGTVLLVVWLILVLTDGPALVVR